MAFDFSWDTEESVFWDINTNGVIEKPIIAGQTYTVGLHNRTNIGGQTGTRTQGMNATFDWQMDSGPASNVPEPATLGLLGLGLAGLGFSRRKLS